MESMISYCLSQAFPGAEIWLERIEEDFSRPAFFVQRISGQFIQEVGNRYLDIGNFGIYYFSDKTKQQLNHDINAVVEQLRWALQTISYQNETLHGYDINHRTEDGVLQFFVTYKRYVAQPWHEETRMQAMNYEIETED